MTSPLLLGALSIAVIFLGGGVALVVLLTTASTNESPTASSTASPTTPSTTPSPATPQISFVQTEKLTLSSPSSFDQFGRAVDIDGSYSVVSAYPNTYPVSSYAGSAAVYFFNGVKWDFDQLLMAADGAVDDNFGVDVGISGTTIIVGAYADGDKGSNSGSAYIYTRNGTSPTPWIEQQKLSASDGVASDWFGYAVDISNNLCVVGARQDRDHGGNSGSAYIYLRVGTTWSEQQKITASDAAKDDQFGGAVGISGNVAVVGAYGNDDAGSASGSAYVFETTNSGANWTERSKIVASDAAEGDIFGSAVDVDDGTVIVGASYKDGSGSNSGSAYVFHKSAATSNWTEVTKLTAREASAQDRFGVSVAVSGNRVVVGAHLSEETERTSQGSAYIFTFNDTIWMQTDKLLANDAGAGDEFGRAVGISGTTAIVGAYRSDTNSIVIYTGSAYIFSAASP